MTRREDAKTALAEAETWLAEHPHFHSARRRDVRALAAALRAAEATLERVRAAHGPKKVWVHDRAYTLVCRCGSITSYPCPTVRALEGSPDA